MPEVDGIRRCMPDEKPMARLRHQGAAALRYHGSFVQKMPTYEYLCRANQTSVEVIHSIREDIKTWGELCAAAGIDPGETAADAPVERLVFTPLISTPTGDSHLKNLGFTKLVRRDHGVYENVTATGNEKRYMNAGDASSLPDIKRKISD